MAVLTVVTAEDATLLAGPREPPGGTAAEEGGSLGEAWLSMRSIALRTMGLAVDADVVLRTYYSAYHIIQGGSISTK